MRLAVITVSHCYNSETDCYNSQPPLLFESDCYNSESDRYNSEPPLTVITVKLLTVITVNSEIHCYNSQSICQIVWEAHRRGYQGISKIF